MTSKVTRRRFAATVAGTALSSLLHPQTAEAQGAGEFSIAIIPDPQYLADFVCTSVSAYAKLIQYIIDNRNLLVNGLPLNVKAILGLGDIVNTCNSTAYESATEAAARQAWNLAFSANIPAFSPPGNHDFVNASLPSRATIGYAFQKGYFSQSAIGERFGPNGIVIAGSNDTASYGGACQEENSTIIPNSGANTYYRLQIGPYRLLFFCLEFHPRTLVLNWMKAIALSNPDHDIFVSTHSYLSDVTGQPCTRGTGQGANKWGPDAYAQGAAPASNSGDEMWAGYFRSIPNLQLIVGGHWIDPASDGGKYWWDTIATNDAGRAVHQVFCNYQERDINCVSGAASSHVMFLRFLPSWSQMEIMVYSVGLGRWVTTGDRTYGTTPSVLANPPFSFVSGAATSDTTAPAAPANLKIANITDDSFALSWSPSTDNVGVTGYRIDVATDAAFTAPLAGYNNKDVGNVATTPVLGLKPSTTYFARVSAYDSAGNTSAPSTAVSATTRDTTAPTVPGNPIITAVTESGFTLTWVASTDNVGVTGYSIVVATDSNFTAVVTGYSNKDVGKVTTTAVSGLRASTTYYARIRAYDAAGNMSGWSTTVSTTTAVPNDPTPLTAPAGLRATSVRRLSFDLAWSASIGNAGATGYLIDVALNPAFTSFVAGYRDRNLGLVTSAQVSGLTRATQYYVRLSAIDNAGNRSGYSATLAVLTTHSGPK